MRRRAVEKRYQVFISSTFQDLQNARQEVSQALLRADCFPAGMELFPAADEEQFEFIKKVIDQSDYYIIISAGRYGSLHPETGLSYTEMEYDYAVAKKKPIMRLLHRAPFDDLRGEFIEATDKGREKLKAFRNKMKSSSLVRMWASPSELGGEVVLGLMHLTKVSPRPGWVRADAVSNEAPKETTQPPRPQAATPKPPRLEPPADASIDMGQKPAETVFSLFEPQVSTLDFVVPTLGKSIDTATVATIFRKTGEKVARDEMILEIETDKVTVECPSPGAGTLLLSASIGDEVRAGQVIGKVILPGGLLGS
ncbi:MAG: DUF4062 domain-containing protein [Pseudomonadota bacterium]